MTQTAVNWLREKLQECYDKEGKLPLAYTFSLLNKAEQMEKQQIMKAYKDHHNLGHIYGLDLEQYYNETYGKE